MTPRLSLINFDDSGIVVVNSDNSGFVVDSVGSKAVGINRHSSKGLLSTLEIARLPLLTNTIREIVVITLSTGAIRMSLLRVRKIYRCRLAPELLSVTT